MPALPFEQFKALRDQGLSVDQINRFSGGQKPATSTDTHQADRQALAKAKGLPDPTQADPRMQGVKTGVLANLPGGLKTATQQIGQDYKGAMDTSVNALSDAMIGKQSGGSAGLQTAAAFFKPLFVDPVNRAFEPVSQATTKTFDALNPVVDKLSGQAPGTTKANTDQHAQQAGQMYDQWATKHPEASKDLESLGTTLQAGLNIAGAEEGFKGLAEAKDRVAPAVNNTVNDVVGKTKAAFNDIKTVASNRSAAAADAKANTITGKITQGDIADAPKTKSALANVDLETVKNAPTGQKYQALEKTLADKESQLVQAKGDALSSHKASYTLDQLNTKVGTTPHNFVSDALDQLDQYYSKTNNVKGQSEIAALKQKATTQGLTLKEIDDIAVRHGQDLNGYNANGELASGLSRQAAENTRQGVKTTARDLFGSESYKQVDAKLSDVIKTRKLVSDVAEKANQLSQKIVQRGLVAKLGYYGGKVMDTLTGGALKNFVNYFIPRGEGLKTLNALDLDAQLTKNLGKLQKLLDTSSEGELLKNLKQIIQENKAKPEPGVTTKQTVKPADLGQTPTSKVVKVNQYDKSFPSYRTPDQVNRATKILNYKENATRPIDMGKHKIRRYTTPMSDIKLRPGVKNGQGRNVVVKAKK